MQKLGRDLAALGVDGRGDSLPPRDLGGGIDAGRPGVSLAFGEIWVPR